jgi:hypothetical protein
MAMIVRGATALLAVSCATQVAPQAAAPGRPAVEVEKVREVLQVTPLELVFSGVRGEARAEENVGMRNMGTAPAELAGVEIVGPDAALFGLGAGPRMPLTLAPGAQASVTVVFSPAADAMPGVRRALLRVRVGPRAQEAPPVDLSGLVTAGRRPDQEPTLAQVVDALGFRLDAGDAGPPGTPPLPRGGGVRSPRFRPARPGAVSVYPVARYSSDAAVAYGYYSGGVPLHRQSLATVAAGHGQTLNPELEPDGRTTFDPGSEPFGLFQSIAWRIQFTDDDLNSGPVRQAARIYPLTSRTGSRIANAYLVAFDEDGDGDYQDCVFVIWNVSAAP